MSLLLFFRSKFVGYKNWSIDLLNLWAVVSKLIINWLRPSQGQEGAFNRTLSQFFGISGPREFGIPDYRRSTPYIWIAPDHHPFPDFVTYMGRTRRSGYELACSYTP